MATTLTAEEVGLGIAWIPNHLKKFELVPSSTHAKGEDVGRVPAGFVESLLHHSFPPIKALLAVQPISLEVLESFLILALADAEYFYAIFERPKLKELFKKALNNTEDKKKLATALNFFQRAYRITPENLQQLLDKPYSRTKIDYYLNNWRLANQYKFNQIKQNSQWHALLHLGPGETLEKPKPANAQFPERKADEVKKAKKAEEDQKALIFRVYSSRLDDPKKHIRSIQDKIELAKGHPKLAYRVLAKRALNKDVETSHAVIFIQTHPESKEVVNRVFQNNWFVGKNYTLNFSELFEAAKSSSLVREKILADRELCSKLLQHDPKELEQLYGEQYKGFMSKVVDRLINRRGFWEQWVSFKDYLEKLSRDQLASLAFHYPEVRKEILARQKCCTQLVQAEFSLLAKLKGKDEEFLSRVLEIWKRNKNKTEPLSVEQRVIFDPQSILNNVNDCFSILNDLNLLQELNTYHKEFLANVVTVCRSNPDKFNVQLEARVIAVIEQDKILKDINVCVGILNKPKLLEELNAHHKEFLDKIVVEALQRVGGTAFCQQVNEKARASLPIKVRVTAIVQKDHYLRSDGNTDRCGILNDVELLQELHKNYKDFLDQVVGKVFAEKLAIQKLSPDTLVFLATYYPQVRENILSKRMFLTVLQAKPDLLQVLDKNAPGFLEKVLGEIFAYREEVVKVVRNGIKDEKMNVLKMVALKPLVWNKVLANDHYCALLSKAIINVRKTPQAAPARVVAEAAAVAPAPALKV